MNEITTQTMPMIALRGMTAFPNMLLHFDVERSMSVAAVNAALNGDQQVFLLTQRDIFDEEPSEAGLFQVGTLCTVKQILRIPGHGMRVMVEGLHRAKLERLEARSPYFVARVSVVEEEPAGQMNSRTQALIRQCQSLFDSYASLTSSQSESVLEVLTSEDPGYLADYIAQNIFIRHGEKQEILEQLKPVTRLRQVIGVLSREVEILEIKNDLQEKTTAQMNQGQREYFLREQIKVIKAELGEGDDADEELEDYRARIVLLGLPEESEEKLLKELSRLAKQPFGSSEASVIRGYLDTVLELPWNHTTRERVDIKAAQKVLDADHFGMEKVKERIIEFLAVRQLAPEVSGGILCFVGPPGVGKTSIASSIAKALGRKFARISLGGIHDEAEIRGHRKTYVGAMPGRIMAAMKQAGSSNPLLLLDEIDKLGKDYRGDPSAALLEALDSEQNTTFRDHYLEIPFDLSATMFITTANTLDTIPRPLLNRMEIIELGSYTDEEKLQIAVQHLLPKQRRRHGLNGRQIKVGDGAIRDMIAGYTKESGVRQLERELAKLCRKAAAKIAGGECKTCSINSPQLHDYLGVRRYKLDTISPVDEVGLVKGLAWTQVGGEILEVEVNVLDGTGKLELTGNLGNVMKESAKAALSYIRARAGKLGIDREFYKTKDIHVHFPEGAIPKDGPSAGITMAVAMISALTGAPVRRNLAMTGEISLRGRILPIGGLKEKTMAALRSDIHTVIIPADNERDLENIDPTVRNALQFITAGHIDDILDVAIHLPSKSPDTSSVPAAVLGDGGANRRGAVTITQ